MFAAKSTWKPHAHWTTDASEVRRRFILVQASISDFSLFSHFSQLLPTSSFSSRPIVFPEPNNHCPSVRTVISHPVRRFSSWRAPTSFAIRLETFLQRPCPWSLPSLRRANKPKPKRLEGMIQRTYLVSGERVSTPWVQKRPSPTGKSSPR